MLVGSTHKPLHVPFLSKIFFFFTKSVKTLFDFQANLGLWCFSIRTKIEFVQQLLTRIPNTTFHRYPISRLVLERTDSNGTPTVRSFHELHAKNIARVSTCILPHVISNY